MPKIRFEGYGGQIFEVELGFRRGVDREIGPDGYIADIAISRTADIGLPLKIAALVRTNGDIVEWYADWSANGENMYWHFDHGSEEHALGRKKYPGLLSATEGHKPTEAQVRALAELYLHKRSVFGLTGFLGAPVADWAFQDLADAQEISKRYGDGSWVYLS